MNRTDCSYHRILGEWPVHLDMNWILIHIQVGIHKLVECPDVPFDTDGRVLVGATLLSLDLHFCQFCRDLTDTDTFSCGLDVEWRQARLSFVVKMVGGQTTFRLDRDGRGGFQGVLLVRGRVAGW